MRVQQLARKEKPRYDGSCLDQHRTAPRASRHVVRFKNPLHGEVVVEDPVHGPVAFKNPELDDLIIARSDGTPTYNFCVVVDDMDMGVTHVIRGDDHLNNTPRQLNMLRALDAVPPVYAHLPMILGPDGTKLSKRHGAVSVLQYQDEGFLAEAVLNYLVRLGWSHGDQEVFSREEMIAAFDIKDVNKSASAFNADKLLWLNQQHMMRAPVRARWPRRCVYAAPGARNRCSGRDSGCSTGVVNAQRERAKTLKGDGATTARSFSATSRPTTTRQPPKNLTAEACPCPGRVARKAWRRFRQSGPPSATRWINAVAAIAATSEFGGWARCAAQPLRVWRCRDSLVSLPIDTTVVLLGRDIIGAP